MVFLAAIGFSASSQEFEKKFYNEDCEIVDEENSTYYSLIKKKYND